MIIASILFLSMLIMTSSSSESASSSSSESASLVAAARENAVNDMLTVIISDSKYFEVTCNWLLSYRCATGSNKGVLVVVFEDEVYRMAKDLGIPVHFHPQRYQPVLRPNGYSPSFLPLTRYRLDVLATIIFDAKISVLQSDSDAIWLRDPFTHLIAPTRHTSAIITSVGTFPNDVARKWGATICTGFIFYNAKYLSRSFFDETNACVEREIIDDQGCFNRVLARSYDLFPTQRLNTGNKTAVVKFTSSNSSIVPLEVTFLSERKVVRNCGSNDDVNQRPDCVVMHCLTKKSGGAKRDGMMQHKLWLMPTAPTEASGPDPSYFMPRFTSAPECPHLRKKRKEKSNSKRDKKH